MGYRLLIADDEKKIIQLIKELGHWDKLGIEIVAECQEGWEALEKISELRPDIVLTDIKMPEMDGLEIIRRAMEQEKHPFFIVLSGYRYFEYARNAIQLGVEDYLLKPIDETALNEALWKVCRKIDAERDKEQDMGQLRSYVEQEKREAFEEFWRAVRRGSTDVDPGFANREACSRNFGMTFAHDIFQCADIFVNIDSLTGSQDLMLGEKIEKICKNLLREHCTYYVAKSREGEYGLLLNYGREKADSVRKGLSALFYNMKDLEELYGEFRLYIGIGGEKMLVRQLGAAWREAEIAAAGCLVYRDSRVIDHHQLEKLMRFSPEDILSKEAGAGLRSAVEILQRDKLGLLFGEIAQRAARYGEAYPGDMLAFMDCLTEQMFSDGEDRKKFGEEVQRLKRNSYSFVQLIHGYYQFCDGYLRQMRDGLERGRGRMIEEAVQYMQAHYAEQLSLEEMAQKAGLSGNYFSRIFKEKTGTGFIEYLTKIRLEEAKGLLAESTNSIKDIAHLVGYYDDKHFIKTFRKQVGISPKEYRKLYAG